MESLAATLVIKPVQPNPWPIVRFMDFLWRAPATLLFTMYMGEDNKTGGRRLDGDAG